jgi:hypothetical protein
MLINKSFWLFFHRYLVGLLTETVAYAYEMLVRSPTFPLCIETLSLASRPLTSVRAMLAHLGITVSGMQWLGRYSCSFQSASSLILTYSLRLLHMSLVMYLYAWFFWYIIYIIYYDWYYIFVIYIIYFSPKLYNAFLITNC